MKRKMQYGIVVMLIVGILVLLMYDFSMMGGTGKGLNLFSVRPDMADVIPGTVENRGDLDGSKQQLGGIEQLFLGDGLPTDTSQRSIGIDDILDGGPGKDGIPAINNPIFLTHDQLVGKPYVTDESLGIVVSLGGETRFYPYSIMNWHEIVNDMFGYEAVAVTFCPLCGSAIVFDRMVDQGLVRFGVSGKLYQSNLLMYDDQTHTLRSQSKGQGVVGQHVGKKLKHIDSDVMSYNDYKNMYPTGTVLSEETGFVRNYEFAPYGDYDRNDTLLFPVSHGDARLPKKEILYVANDGDVSMAFVKQRLVQAGQGSVEVGGKVYTATFVSGRVDVLDGNGNIIPGYHEMWFSWITHNPKSKAIRGVED